MNTISTACKTNWAEHKCLSSSTEAMPQITNAHPAPRKIPFYKIHCGLPQKQFCPTPRMSSRCLCLFVKDHFHLLWSPQAFTFVSSSFLICRQWLYLGPCTRTWRAWAVRPQSKFGEHTGPELGSKIKPAMCLGVASNVCPCHTSGLQCSPGSTHTPHAHCALCMLSHHTRARSSAPLPKSPFQIPNNLC